MRLAGKTIWKCLGDRAANCLAGEERIIQCQVILTTPSSSLSYISRGIQNCRNIFSVDPQKETKRTEECPVCKVGCPPIIAKEEEAKEVIAKEEEAKTERKEVIKPHCTTQDPKCTV